MGKFIDISGNKYSKLTVISYMGISYWKCQCECGNISRVKTGDLKNGNTKSCGCTTKNTKHNLSKTSEYVAWTDMKGRCNNSNYKNYKDYGGRGIKVHERWLNSFENFIEDMGNKPSKNYSLDREDNDGDYTPDNCRWVTIREQNLNKRNTLLFEYNNVAKPLSKWCEELNLNYREIKRRIKTKKWDINMVLSIPTSKPYIPKTKFKQAPVTLW